MSAVTITSAVLPGVSAVAPIPPASAPLWTQVTSAAEVALHTTVDILSRPDFSLALDDLRTVIVVLGYGLDPDGSMRPELVERLQTTYMVAVTAPELPIIVTGGNPRTGVTEAEAMRNWLVGRGLPAERIIPETQARTTVGNALNSERIMADIGARQALLITSSDHLPRALLTFVGAGVTVAGALTPDQLPELLRNGDDGEG